MSFLDLYTTALPAGVTLPAPLPKLMAWLDANGARRGDSLSTIAPAAKRPWSELAFQPQPDTLRHWLGRDDLDHVVTILMNCGGDGSLLAYWRRPDGPAAFVFMGSEGNAFTVTEDAVEFARMVTMGYVSLELRDDFDRPPQSDWPTEAVAEVAAAVERTRGWVTQTFGGTYPRTAGDRIPNFIGSDPFAAWVEANNGYR